MAKCILVPYDGSTAAQRAIPCAVGLARAAGARIVLVRGCPDDIDVLLAAEIDAQALAHRIRSAGVPVTIRVRAGEAVDVVAQELRTWGPEWMVLSSHGSSGAGRWLFGGVADQLLRMTGVPTVLIPGSHDRGWPEGKRPRVLAPLDGSSEAEQALPALRRLVEALSAHAILLRVVEPPIPGPYAYGQCAPYVEFDAHVELGAARDYLHEIAAGLKLGAGDVECHATVGTPGVSIPRFARDHHADLVLLTLSGAGKTSATLGGAGLGTLQLAGIPLVLVPVVAAVRTEERPVGPMTAALPERASTDSVHEPGGHEDRPAPAIARNGWG